MEKLLARLERRFGRHAPEGIILWIVGISGALHLLVFARPQTLYLLWLDPEAVLRGEAWRVITFLFAPTGPVTGMGLVWTILGLWFLHTMGSALEAQWGSFRFDVFFLLGALGTLAVGFLFGPVSGTFVAEALLIAFAIEFPDYEVLLLILPVKVKYLGILSGALMMRGAGVTRRKATPALAPPARKARVCAKCGRSDADDPNLEFRVCDCQEKCRGKLTEYCLEHARAH